MAPWITRAESGDAPVGVRSEEGRGAQDAPGPRQDGPGFTRV